MNRQTASSILKSLQPQLAGRGIAHAALFGSIARGQATHSSDLDVLLTPAEGVSLNLFDLGALQSMLEEVFPGNAVDIVLAPVRKTALRHSIDRDAAHVF